MRPFRSLTRFRLTTALVAMALASITFAFYSQYRVPMKSGVILSAVCYSSDWEKVVPISSTQLKDSCVVSFFRGGSPSDIFDYFSAQPRIWRVGAVQDFDSGHLATFSALRRDMDEPVERTLGDFRLSEQMEDERMEDIVSLNGTFEEFPLQPKRYYLDFAVQFTSRRVTPSKTQSDESLRQSCKQRCRYIGPAKGNVLVFSQPIDDQLTHLVIVDLQK